MREPADGEVDGRRREKVRILRYLIEEYRIDRIDLINERTEHRHFRHCNLAGRSLARSRGAFKYDYCVLEVMEAWVGEYLVAAAQSPLIVLMSAERACDIALMTRETPTGLADRVTLGRPSAQRAYKGIAHAHGFERRRARLDCGTGSGALPFPRGLGSPARNSIGPIIRVPLHGFFTSAGFGGGGASANVSESILNCTVAGHLFSCLILSAASVSALSDCWKRVCAS